MQLYLSIWADTNDADYIHGFNKITAEQLERFRPLIEAIKGFQPYQTDYQYTGLPPSKRTHPHNFPRGECLRKDMGEKSVKEIYAHIDPQIIEEFCENWMPNDEYGTHTIESIEVYEVAEVTKLL